MEQNRKVLKCRSEIYQWIELKNYAYEKHGVTCLVIAITPRVTFIEIQMTHSLSFMLMTAKR